MKRELPRPMCHLKWRKIAVVTPVQFCHPDIRQQQFANYGKAVDVLQTPFQLLLGRPMPRHKMRGGGQLCNWDVIVVAYLQQLFHELPQKPEMNVVIAPEIDHCGSCLWSQLDCMQRYDGWLSDRELSSKGNDVQQHELPQPQHSVWRECFVFCR